jgi:hypothetical protein
MPELTLSRTNPQPPPMVCMHCGAPATNKVEWRVENRRPEPGRGGGTDTTPAPSGDDPVSLVIGLLLLPLALWGLLKALAAAVGSVGRSRSGPAVPSRPLPPLDPPSTLIVVTTCDRHRRFRDRFVWAGVAMVVGLAALWVWAVVVTRRVMGTDDTDLAVTLVVTAVFSSVLLPIALSVWYVFAGPVTVERVTQDAVVLDRVRQAYFEAAGTVPGGAR